MTINDILNNKNNKENKELALMQVLNLTKSDLITQQNKKITLFQYNKYKRIITKMINGIPIQYITKSAYFYNKKYKVNKNVLIPRPETEYLVEQTNNLIEKYFNKENISIIDIGTGSGVIAITLKELNNNYNITATDISKKAINIAKKNAKNKKIKFIKTNLYDNINEKFDVLISNPPYIPMQSKTIEKNVKKYEPHLALYGGVDGLDYYRKIIKNIKSIVKSKNIIAFETGENQNNKIEKLIKKEFPNAKIIKKRDYNNYDRYIFVINE